MNVFKTVSKKKKLVLSLLLSSLSGYTVAVDAPTTPLEVAHTTTQDVSQSTSLENALPQTTLDLENYQKDKAEYSGALEMVIHQLEQLDVLFDTYGQGDAHGSLGSDLTPEQKKIKGKILTGIRKEISFVHTQAGEFISKEQVVILAHKNAQLTDIATTIVTKGFKALLTGKAVQPITRSLVLSETTLSTTSAQDLIPFITGIDQEIAQLMQQTNELGLTPLNKKYRKLRSFWKSNNLDAIAERMITYPAILCWGISLCNHEQLGNMGWLSTPFLWIKNWVSGEAPNATPGANGTNTIAVAGYVDVPVDEKTGEQAGTARWTGEKVAVNKISNTTGKQLGKTDVVSSSEIKGQIEGLKPTTPTTVTLPNDGPSIDLRNAPWLSKTLGTIQPVIDFFGGPKAMFSLPITVLAADYIKNELLYGAHHAMRAKRRLDDKLFGSIQQGSTWWEREFGKDHFEDVVGREEIKSELNKVIDYVCNPEKYDRLNITVEKGFLFVGPSQNGKSAMIKALGNEIRANLKRAGKPVHVRLLPVAVKDIIKSEGLTPFITMAESWGCPVIIAIDEIDMLRVQRDQDSKMLADMLTAMSNGLSASEKNMIIIIGSTNKPMHIDFALRQHGRFGKILYFDKPTFKDRVAFFIRECENRFMDTERFDFTKLAHETEGASYGTLIAVVKRAFLLARMGNMSATQMHFEHAVDTEVKNIVFTGQALPAEKEEIIAVHNAGKALVSTLLQPKKVLCKVTTLPCTQELEEEAVWQATVNGKSPINKQKDQQVIKYGGVFAYNLTDQLNMEVQEELVKQCKIILAGNIAQKVMELQTRSFEKNDSEQALALARRITFEGIEVLQGLPEKISEELLTKAYEQLKAYEQEVTTLLTENKNALVALAKELQQHKLLTREQVQKVVTDTQK